MKRKLVTWGKNPKEERIVIALELLAEENQVKTHILPTAVATEEVYKGLMNSWRVDQPFEMPEGTESSAQELAISSSLIPEGYSVENDSLLERAKTEWHFVVLSAKLHSTYKSELEDFKDKIEKLSEYDAAVWESLKGYWNKVQAQVREKNLFWDHANELRNGTNSLFSKMKELRAVIDEEFRTESKKYAESILAALNTIEEKVKENVNLGGLFNELKDLQKKFRETKFTKEDRNTVWTNIDNAFKTVKEKKYGKENMPTNSPEERIQRRYDGLMKAIEKMQRSVKRDDDELKFQGRRAERTEGQLELQIRQAKIKMLEQRVESKRVKLKDMLKTEKELSKKLAKLKAQKPAPAQKTSAAPTPPAPEASAKAAEPLKAKAEEPTKAKEEPAKEEPVKEDPSIVDALGATLGESLGDVMDTVKAVAGVIGARVNEEMQEIIEDLKSNDASNEEE